MSNIFVINANIDEVLLTLSSSAQKNLLSNSTSYPLGNTNDKSQFDFYYKVQTKLLVQSTEYYFLTIDYQLVQKLHMFRGSYK